MVLENNNQDDNQSKSLAEEIIGVEPMVPPESIKKLLRQRYQWIYDYSDRPLSFF